VGKRIRGNLASRLFLQGIVANGAGGGKALLDITLFEQLPRTAGMVGPDTGKTAGLQFLLHGELDAFGFAQLRVSNRRHIGNMSRV